MGYEEACQTKSLTRLIFDSSGQDVCVLHDVYLGSHRGFCIVC